MLSLIKTLVVNASLVLASLSAALFLAACDVAWTNGKTHTVLYDTGGWIQWYVNHVEDLKRRGIKPQLRGKHDSAATMLLGVPGVCVHPTARFGFHGSIPVLPGETKDYGDNLMRQYYKPALQDWYDKHARHLQIVTEELTGQELHDKFGYDLCPV